MFRRVSKIILFSLIMAISYPAVNSYAITLSEPVELEVPATKARINGLAAPDSIVTISENNVVLASVSTDSNGYFNSEFTMLAGIHTFQTKYIDKNGQSSQLNSTSLSIAPQQVTEKKLFLSPTIALGSQSLVSRGSLVVVRGYTTPNSLVSISLDYGDSIFQTSSNNLGFYQYNLDTSALLDGNHTISVNSILGVDLSDTSKQIVFTVSTSDGSDTPDIVVSPELIPPPLTTLPQDGAIIDGNSVTIYGESVPNAQINIYENGIAYGSIFSDSSGKWSFYYLARFSPVSFSFEACLEGRCSVQSQAITINFSKLITSCNQTVGLDNYRFWGLYTGETFEISLKEEFLGELVIDWGDGITEKFSSDKDSRTAFNKMYEKPGNYNGKISFKYNSCQDLRYFSVNVLAGKDEVQIWVFLVLAASLVIGTLVNRKDKKDNIQK